MRRVYKEAQRLVISVGPEFPARPSRGPRLMPKSSPEKAWAWRSASQPLRGATKRGSLGSEMPRRPEVQPTQTESDADPFQGQ